VAISGTRVTVGTTPTALFTADSDASHVTVRSRAAATSVDLGGANVAVNAGFELASGEQVTIPLASGEVLYAIHVTGGARLDVIRSGIG
jgi:hypothetical protein